MAIKKQIVKGCCGSGSSIIFYLDNAVKKEHLQLFIDNGYTVPPHYANSGIFYARKDSLVATTSLGTTKLTVKCGAHDRDKKLDEFENLLNQALNS